MVITPEEVARICELVAQLTGIQWDSEKSYLIESRFRPMLREHQIGTLTELIEAVKSSTTSPVRADFIDAVTTRETLFFRDDGPFSALRNKALPEIIDAKAETFHRRKLRIWSAACSSGQEVYSLGIVVRELIDDIDEWDITILGTDLSPAALASASRGIYSDFDMSRGISAAIRDKHFVKVPNGWQICDEVRSLACFEPRNLLESFASLGPFDVIFCRNVAIYFDEQGKRDLFERLSGVLFPHGAIFIGSSETAADLGERWIPHYHCRGVFFQPNLTSSVPMSAVPSNRPTADPVHSLPCQPAASHPKSMAPLVLPKSGIARVTTPSHPDRMSRFAKVAAPTRTASALAKSTETDKGKTSITADRHQKSVVPLRTLATAIPGKPVPSNLRSSAKVGNGIASRQVLEKARRARLAKAPTRVAAVRNETARPLGGPRSSGSSSAENVSPINGTAPSLPAVVAAAGLTRSNTIVLPQPPAVGTHPKRSAAPTFRSSAVTSSSSTASELLLCAKRVRDAKKTSASAAARARTAGRLRAEKSSNKKSVKTVDRIGKRPSPATSIAAAELPLGST